LASANVRLEKQARELALVQEKLARILDSAPQAASDVEGWAVAMAGEVRRALGALELGVFALRGSAFEALSSDGDGIPPPDPLKLEATASGEIPLVAPNQRTTIPLKGPTGQLYGALVILLPRALKEDERRLLVGFAQQLGGALEMKRLRSDLHAAAASRAASLREYHERGIATLQICGACSRCFDHTATVCTLCGGELHSPRAVPFKLLDRYRFENLLGQGGMGMVLAARDERLERDVAIKLIKPDQLADDRTRVRFEQEARTIARIAHRNVVAVFDSGELEDGTAYLVMERLEGCDLASLIALAGPGRPEEVAALVRQTSAALSAAHGEGIIHRDIKPQNIFREATAGPRLAFKVLDFGLAKSLGAEGGLTLTGTVVGTPAYMSPEQVRGSVLDARTDLYSLAVVVYEALTGARLVDTDDIGSAFLTVATSVPLAPSALAAGLSKEVDALLLAALEKDRERRPHDIAAWGEALGAALEASGDAATTTAGWVAGSLIAFD
ncbi:MAG: serine/threonine protein kinase, partial [Acidobacteria bacterium]|nr:serine/threonine protein kinase [Acidobacteriota bacterium]